GKLCLQSVGNRLCDVAFDRKDVGQFPIISLRPKMRVGQRINELHIDAYLIVRFLHAAFENVRHTELLRDLGKIIRRAFEMLCRCARNHFQVCDLGQAGKNFVLNSLCKISIAFFFTQAFKRKYCDRLCGQFGASRTGGSPTGVTPDEKQTNGERGSNDHDKYPGILSRLPGRRREIDIFGALDSFRRELEGPGDDKRDWESCRDQYDHQPHDPIWNLKEWKNLGGNLNQEPSDNRIGDSYFVNIPPLQLGEEIIDFHSVSLCRVSGGAVHFGDCPSLDRSAEVPASPDFRRKY